MIIFRRSNRTFGFTLIELLIVVAIIAILAAIAVPNFLEAQVRAKVSRAKADMRSLAVAIEAYAVDENAYPHVAGKLVVNPGGQFNRGGTHLMWNLTTPIAYINSVDRADPFLDASARDEKGDLIIGPNTVHYSLGYINIRLFRGNKGSFVPAWGLFSLGPDKIKGPNPYGGGWGNSGYGKDPPVGDDRRFTVWNYDSTNGSRSKGDILHFP